MTCTNYAQGQCTDYCARSKSWVQCGWGDASNWLNAASAAGLPIGNAPMAGGIAVWGPGNESANAPASSSGHVADVESVNGDGTFTVSEMNFNGGIGVVDYRTVTSRAGLVGFIYPPGSSGSSSSSTSSASAATMMASTSQQSLGESFGLQAAQSIGVGASGVMRWASGNLVALLVAAVAIYVLFATDVSGGPEARA